MAQSIMPSWWHGEGNVSSRAVGRALFGAAFVKAWIPQSRGVGLAAEHCQSLTSHLF